MKIWRCPKCEGGIRAPERLGRDDVRRFCLSCSKLTGRLVQRAIPSRESEKQRAAERRAAATAKRQERRALADVAVKADVAQLAASFDRPMNRAADWLRAWAPRIVALKSLRAHYAENYPGRTWSPTIQIRQGGGVEEVIARDDVHAWMQRHRGGWTYAESADVPTVIARTGRHSASGHAWPWEHRLCVTTGNTAADDLSTLIHELAHLAAPSREHHGPRFVIVQRDAVEELTGEKIEGWKRRGYHCRVDTIERWLKQQGGA